MDGGVWMGHWECMSGWVGGWWWLGWSLGMYEWLGGWMVVVGWVYREGGRVVRSRLDMCTGVDGWLGG